MHISISDDIKTYVLIQSNARHEWTEYSGF